MRPRGESGFGAVEAQTCHARIGIGAVAEEAIIREDGADFALEIYAGGGLRRGARAEGERGERDPIAAGADAMLEQLSLLITPNTLP